MEAVSLSAVAFCVGDNLVILMVEVVVRIVVMYEVGVLGPCG